LDIPIGPSEVSEMQQCFDLLREDRPQASALASAKLGMLLNEWRYHWKGPPRRDRRPHREALEEVIRLMRRNLQEPLSGEELAERISLGTRRFRQIFREATGRSPKQYYDSLRLTMAAELLRMGGVSVADIADRLGYSSAFHFSRAFKKHHGVPPSAYLRQ
jgi:transcriptional regulator GlxA family with amidase domain